MNTGSDTATPRQQVLSLARQFPQRLDNFHLGSDPFGANGQARQAVTELIDAALASARHGDSATTPPGSAQGCTVARLEHGTLGVLYLWGSPGSGKSHLLHAACGTTTQGGGSAMLLSLASVANQPPAPLLRDLDSMTLLCLDELDAIAGNDAWELALFHLLNRCQETGTRIVVAARQAPGQLRLGRPELGSRLAWGLVIHMLPLGHADRQAVILERARDLGLSLSPEVASYLHSRFDRDLKALLTLLAELERETLATQRRLTVPFLRHYLQTRRGPATTPRSGVD